MRLKTFDNNSYASDPGSIRLSHKKLNRFHPELYELKGINKLLNRPSEKQQYWLTHFEEHLLHADSRAALVISIEPLLIAAYTDELDCIAMLSFSNELVSEYGLSVGFRLLTVNSYIKGHLPVADLHYGPAAYHRYSNFHPLIAEFLSEDIIQTAHRKNNISEQEWKRTEICSQEYLLKFGQRSRDGRPLLSDIPAHIGLLD